MTDTLTPAAADTGKDIQLNRPRGRGVWEPDASLQRGVLDIQIPREGWVTSRHDDAEAIHLQAYRLPDAYMEAERAEVERIAKTITRRHQVAGDPERYARTIHRILQRAALGMTPYAIARELREDGIPTASGARFEADDPASAGKVGEYAWRPLTVQRIIQAATREENAP